MAARCDLCGKGVQFGNRVSHSHHLTRRKWKPNLHVVRVRMEDGTVKRMKLCTKCMRKVQKAV